MKMRNSKSGISFTIYMYALFLVSTIVTSMVSLSSLSSNLAYAHTFSQNESANFLSLTEQIRAEAQLVLTNLQNNNNLALAQAHANNAVNILNNNNSILNEIRERNIRIATTLENTLQHLRNNITSSKSPFSLTLQGKEAELKPQLIERVNQTVLALNNTLDEATTVRIDPDQRNNSTTWALAFAGIINATLKNYGIATGAPIDLNNVSNMAMMMSMEESNSSSGINNNSNSMGMSMNGMEMSSSSSSSMELCSTKSTNNNDNNNMKPLAKVVNETAYQTAQFLANRTLVEIFDNHLKHTTTIAQVNNNNTSSLLAQQQQINQLQNSTIALNNAINNKASPGDVMMIVHGSIHPILIEQFGLKSH